VHADYTFANFQLINQRIDSSVGLGYNYDSYLLLVAKGGFIHDINIIIYRTVMLKKRQLNIAKVGLHPLRHIYLFLH